MVFWRKVLGEWMEGEAGRGAERPAVGACVGWADDVSKSGGVAVAGAASSLEEDSRTDGSEGGGPSMAHRRDSYFERMNDSILLRKWDQKGNAPSRKDSLVGRDMTGFEMGFPVDVCTAVAPFLDGLQGCERWCGWAGRAL